MTASSASVAPGAESGASGVTSGDVTGLWASYQVTALNVRDFPSYGSPAWLALRSNDPRRAAAIIAAAEQWRRHEERERWLDDLLDNDPERWFSAVTAEANQYARRICADLARRPDQVELRRKRQLSPPRKVVATSGWPPVAIPGRPGWYRHCGPNGEQIDLPTNEPQTGQETPA
ncbi:hypothetical protein SSP531S_24590 [Streptomyces spongiicola]|uniref:DUF2742 domain-containing protein n=1 Tax=Streptomyces spongiicola TaxID=1690221 RepID=A0A388SWU0_9ACTN|nr:DUF2742 domain-containing protein [Streptomyces spongiicola]GBQ01029.1 hypothetical protein SSP531S_24590 [Streptomyces spongiicola]